MPEWHFLVVWPIFWGIVCDSNAGVFIVLPLYWGNRQKKKKKKNKTFVRITAHVSGENVFWRLEWYKWAKEVGQLDYGVVAIIS